MPACAGMTASEERRKVRRGQQPPRAVAPCHRHAQPRRRFQRIRKRSRVQGIAKRGKIV